MRYRDAAVTLWGEAGAFAHDCYQRWRPLLPELPEELPITIGLVAYGHCRGLTRPQWEHGPRITLFSATFKAEFGQGHRSGRNVVADTVLHEMIHAWLAVTGQETDHSAGWYAACNRLSGPVLGVQHSYVYDPKKIGRKSVRVRNLEFDPEAPEGAGNRRTKVIKVPTSESLIHSDMLVWPHPFRPADYERGEPISCPTY